MSYNISIILYKNQTIMSHIISVIRSGTFVGISLNITITITHKLQLLLPTNTHDIHARGIQGVMKPDFR